jgi:hypothetical protein
MNTEMNSNCEKTKLGRWGRGAGATVALCLSLIALGSCKDLLDVSLPAQLTDDALNTPTSATTLFSTFITQYENAFNDVVWETFGREDGGEVPTTRDAGYFYYDVVAGQFGNMSKSLHFATLLHDKLDKEWTKEQVPQRGTYLPISSIYAGAALGWMGSALCESAVEVGKLQSADQTLASAETWLTKALAEIDANGADFAVPYGIATSAKSMAYGLRAQVRWMKGDKAGAAADAALVPNGFRAFATREATPARLNKPFNSGTENRYQELFGVIDFWKGPANPVTGKAWPAQIPFTGYRDLGILPDGRAVRDDGLPIRTKGPYTTTQETTTAVADTRVKTVLQQLNGASYSTYMNARYTGQGDDLPIVNWKEMILIRAEAAGGQAAIDLVNQIRTADNLPKVTYLTGTATADQIRYMIVEERRRALWLEARYFYTKLKNLDITWFPRSNGQSPAKGNAFRGGIRYLMPNSEFQFNKNLTLADRATGCEAIQRPINIDVGTG